MRRASSSTHSQRDSESTSGGAVPRSVIRQLHIGFAEPNCAESYLLFRGPPAAAALIHRRFRGSAPTGRRRGAGGTLKRRNAAQGPLETHILRNAPRPGRHRSARIGSGSDPGMAAPAAPSRLADGAAAEDASKMRAGSVTNHCSPAVTNAGWTSCAPWWRPRVQSTAAVELRSIFLGSAAAAFQLASPLPRLRLDRPAARGWRVGRAPLGQRTFPEISAQAHCSLSRRFGSQLHLHDVFCASKIASYVERSRCSRLLCWLT